MTATATVPAGLQRPDVITGAEAANTSAQHAGAPGGLAFVKGHGTENDFILIPDRDDRLELTPALVQALCDRHAGIGADGVIRIAPAAGSSSGAASSDYLMDYRNADGSVAEMCGNGARVFALYLWTAGWADPGPLTFATRAGRCTARRRPDGAVEVDLGAARVGAQASVELGGELFVGTTVDVGNPHLVVFPIADPASLDLSAVPVFDRSVFPAGGNLEFVHEAGSDDLVMRVIERGVGETRSCGTGTVAAAAAYLARSGRRTGVVTVRVPGGVVEVGIDDGWCTLAGPAVLVASGVVPQTFLDAVRRAG